MQAPWDLKATNGPDHNASSVTSTIKTEMQCAPLEDTDLYQNGAVHLGLPPEHAFTTIRQELTDSSQAQATTHNNNAASTPQTPHFDPRALLNPKTPNTKRPASSGGDTNRGRTDATIPGQVALVERLHNVQERTASSAKRVKTENPPNDKNEAFLSFGGSSALELQNSAAQPRTLQSGPSIDLTMSDDEDDLQVLADNMTEEVCIGKVKQTYVQAHCVPFPDPKKPSGHHSGQGRVKVSFRRGGGQKGNLIILVLDGLAKEFGRVDMKTAQGLAPLMDAAKINGLKWLAWTDQRRKQPNEGPPGSQFSGLIGMTLQLYCPRKHADDIGKALKNRNLLLDNPSFELQRHDYYNPQTFASYTRTQMSQPSFQQTMFSQHTGGMPTSSYVLRSQEEIRADVQDVFDTVINSSEEVPMRDASVHIKTELYPHQKQALYFMVDKEEDHSGAEYDDRKDSLWKPHYRNNGRKSYIHVITGEEMQLKPPQSRGGILADEMGLGKTLSVLSLICDDDSIAAAHNFAHAMKPPPIQPGSPMIQPTINSRATLLICPLSTMTNWKEQIKEHFPAGSAIKWTRYHGSERFDMTPRILADNDIVVTTYHIIAKDILDRRRPLPYINWFRIVLDEAHTIRNPTNQSKAACMLLGQRRWAVTGTPVQNRLEDLGALFNFIKLCPFDTSNGFNQFIIQPFKNADPEVIAKLQLLVSTVTIRRTKEIIKDEVPSKTDIVVRLSFSKAEQQLHDWFEQDTQRKVTAVTQGDKMGGHSYAKILTAILNLRLICAHGRDLLSDEALKTTDGMTYDNPVEIGEEELIAPVLNRQQAYGMLSLLENTSVDHCVYCNNGQSILNVDSDDEDEDGSGEDIIGYMTMCYHLVCPKHLKKLKAMWKENLITTYLAKCGICEDRNRPDAFELRHSDYNKYLEEQEQMRKDPKMAKKVNSYTGPHTKTQALLDDLHLHRKWSDEHPAERPIKSIVFSSWTTHLDLIEIALKNHCHHFVRLDGRMSREARDKSMRLFREDPTVRVMLVSIGAGGLGLNLTTANKVYMMEPQFNPAAEAQAVDRVHRLGQDRAVVIKRFIMEKSFEEKMLDLQAKKKDLANLTMERQKKGQTKQEATAQRMQELRSLFR